KESHRSTVNCPLLPHIPRTSIPISIPNQEPNQKLMRPPARCAEIGPGEVVSITHIKCISNIQSRHCREAIELPDASTSPQEVAVLKLHIQLPLVSILESAGNIFHHQRRHHVNVFIQQEPVTSG